MLTTKTLTPLSKHILWLLDKTIRIFQGLFAVLGFDYHCQREFQKYTFSFNTGAAQPSFLFFNKTMHMFITTLEVCHFFVISESFF